jgi:hypothetical protein
VLPVYAYFKSDSANLSSVAGYGWCVPLFESRFEQTASDIFCMHQPDGFQRFFFRDKKDPLRLRANAAWSAKISGNVIAVQFSTGNKVKNKLIFRQGRLESMEDLGDVFTFSYEGRCVETILCKSDQGQEADECGSLGDHDTCVNGTNSSDGNGLSDYCAPDGSEIDECPSGSEDDDVCEPPSPDECPGNGDVCITSSNPDETDECTEGATGDSDECHPYMQDPDVCVGGSPEGSAGSGDECASSPVEQGDTDDVCPGGAQAQDVCYAPGDASDECSPTSAPCSGDDLETAVESPDYCVAMPQDAPPAE